LSMELIKKLLEAGVHFGHQTRRWNPKMEKYIFGKKSGIHIIDLEKTSEAIKQAQDFFTDLAAGGGSVLFIGTKRQARDVIKSEAERAGTFYITHRWLGGLLTNFETVKKSIKRYKDLETMKTDGTFSKFKKKEVFRLEKEMEKLKKNFEGILNMERLPKALFIIDVKSEEIAVKEASKLSIPICAIVDTNSNPDNISYPIPGNDDAVKSIKFITAVVADSVIEGRKRFLDYLGKELVKEEKDKALGSSAPVEAEEETVEEYEEKIELEDKKDTRSLKPKGRLKPQEEKPGKSDDTKRRAKK